MSSMSLRNLRNNGLILVVLRKETIDTDENKNYNLSSEKSIASGLSRQEALNSLIVDAIQDIKGKNILKLDLTHLDDAPTDFFIIAEGESITQVRAIADNVQKRIKEEVRSIPLSLEGLSDSNWILIDYFDTVVHVFYPETRRYYDLEDLWSDARIIEYQNL